MAMIRTKSVVLVSLLTLGFVLAGLVQRSEAQVLFGSVSGTVTDQSGATVSKAHISSVNRATGVQKETDADARRPLYAHRPLSGRLRRYSHGDRVQAADSDGRARWRQRCHQYQFQSADRLGIGKGHGRGSGGNVADGKDRRSHRDPGKGYPGDAAQSVSKLSDADQPGAWSDPGVFQNAIADTPERALSTNINGTNRNNNNTRVDGAADVFVWLPHHTVYVPPAETIQEVNVSTNNFDPEQGMTGGAAITVITKSGSNQFHGVLFEYHEDQTLRARQYFETPAVQPKKGTSAS